jgi:hypothetical protein
MADSTNFDPEVLRTATQVGRAPKASTPHASAGGLVVWATLMFMGVVAIPPMITLVKDEAATLSLLAASDAEVMDTLATDWSSGAPPAWLEVLSERSLNLPKPDLASSEAAARAAVEADPSRAHVWARLAWLETQKIGGKVNDAALSAITKSMDACPLCSQELIAWRFNFVLANWTSIPDPLRRRAFEHADLLRWIGPNAEFLAEMRVKAIQNRIPFDEYRSAVDTPVRTWDITSEASRPPA